MSGPWDRPSPDQDAEWPSDDLDSPRSPEPTRAQNDPWGSGDLWSEPSSDRSGTWSDWPSTEPPDDFYFDEPPRTLSDPWAESWSDADEPPAPPSRAPEWSPLDEPADAGASPRRVEAEPGLPEAAAASMSEPAWQAAPEPRTEPWSPDADPWAAAAAPSAEPAEPPTPPPPVESQTRELERREPDETQLAESASAGPAPAEPSTAEPAQEPDEVARPPGHSAPWPPPASSQPPVLDWLPDIDRPPQPDVPLPRPRADASAMPIDRADEYQSDAVVRDERIGAPESEPEPADAAELEPEPEPADAAELEPEPERPRWWSRLGLGRAEPEPEPEADAAADFEDWQEPETQFVEPEMAETEPAVAEPEPELAEYDAYAPVAEPAETTADDATLELDAERDEGVISDDADAAAAFPEGDGIDHEPEAESRAPWWRPWASPSVEAGAADEPTIEDTEVEEPAAAELEEAGRAEPIAADEAEPEPEADSEADSELGADGVDSEPTVQEAEPTTVWAEPASEEVGPEAADEPYAGSVEPATGSPWVESGWGTLVEDEAYRDAHRHAQPESEPEVVSFDPGTDQGRPWEDPEPWPVERTQVLPTSWEPPPAPPGRSAELEPSVGDIRTRLRQSELELDEEGEPHPSTAEQAVPWLIGFILLLAGMVIVLLALIFAGDGSLGGAAAASPSPTNASVVTTESPAPTPSPTAPAASASAEPTVSVPPTPTPLAIPEYGPLEMVYQGRAAALAPIYLLHHDFTSEAEPEVMAQDPAFDVRRFAWSPDGRVGAGLLADVLVSIEPGEEKRRLGDGITTITFGADASTVYAVRITQDGTNDVANVLRIDFASGDSTELAAITYPRPSLAEETPVAEAQFADDGGPVRLYWMEDDVLRLWALGAGTWEVDPTSGEVTDLEEQLPALWSADGRRRITSSLSQGTTTLNVVNGTGGIRATTSVEGLVSHLRWSPNNEVVVFTVGRATAGGGVMQNLYLWYLEDGVAPVQITDSGAAFGAEWLGTTARWEEPEA